MRGTGLSLVPLSKRLRAVAVGTIGYYELELCFLLIHPSGESIPLEITWAVCPDRGRPLDKAMATANTSALAYLLRDLLLMPRVDPQEEMDARDDGAGSAREPATPTPTPASPPAPSAETISPEQYDELTKLMTEAQTDHQKFCEHYQINGVSMLPSQHFNDARGKLLVKVKPTPEQCDRIDALCGELKWDTATANRKLREFMPGAQDLASLTRLQAGLVIDAMAKSAAVQGSK
jgi:hypothetical protein